MILNEPSSALQRVGEGICGGHKYYEEATTCDDPCRRLILTYMGIIQALYSAKTRKRKPFNPMLGETFEFVTPDYRFIAEKI